MEQYKGEVPSNVVDPAKKQDKPYYKKVGFWVAIGLMVFGIGCSIFGAIQGARYARAVERAAQTIADAQDANTGALSRPRLMAYPSSGNVVDFSVSGTATHNAPYYIDLSTGNQYGTMATLPNNVPYIYYYNRIMFGYKLDGIGNALNRSTFRQHFLSYNFTGVSIADWLNSVSGDSQYAQMSVGTGETYTLQGTFVFDMPAYYEGVGYSSGYADGYSSGYDDAYRDVSQSIELLYNPSLSVTNPVVTYTVSVDGAVVASGNLEGGNEASQRFTYGRQPQSVVTITLQASYRFWLAWSKGEAIDPSSFNSITYADPVYIPTYWDDALFEVVSFTEATPARTFYTLVFDPAHNADSPIGDYSLGYRDGYADGTNYGYSSGVAVGSSDGYSNGYTMGFEAGRTDALTNDNVLAGMFVTAFQQPFNQLYRFLNFNLLGVNFLALFTAFITVSIGLVVIKKVL